METQAKQSPRIPHFLNEKSVALLESQWADLPQQAFCESSDHGWRIHLAGPNSVFSQAGFTENEVVAPEELLQYARSSGQKSLVERLLAIFEHIKKAA